LFQAASQHFKKVLAAILLQREAQDMGEALDGARVPKPSANHLNTEKIGSSYAANEKLAVYRPSIVTFC